MQAFVMEHPIITLLLGLAALSTIVTLIRGHNPNDKA